MIDNNRDNNRDYLYFEILFLKQKISYLQISNIHCLSNTISYL